MTLNLVHAKPTSVGLLSSGGTESILLAILAYREQGRKKGITEPEVEWVGRREEGRVGLWGEEEGGGRCVSRKGGCK